MCVLLFERALRTQPLSAGHSLTDVNVGCAVDGRGTVTVTRGVDGDFKKGNDQFSFKEYKKVYNKKCEMYTLVTSTTV